MQMTYRHAIAEFLQETEIGYTLASQDRLWTVFTFDLWSENEYWGERLFYVRPDLTSYEMWDEELVWTSREEAEAFAEEIRERYKEIEDEAKRPSVYVINWGDDHRWEKYVLGLAPAFTPRFRGSEDAVKALHDVWTRRKARGI